MKKTINTKQKELVKVKSGRRQIVAIFILYTLPIILTLCFLAYQLLPYIQGKIHTFSKLSFYTLVEEVTSAINPEVRGKPLYKNEKIIGEFRSTENNLGLVLIRFYNFGRVNSGEITFKIKEKSAPNWYAENKYTIGQFQPNEYFTIGFPLIANSQGRTYQFEITSIDGRKGDVIALSERKPSFAAVYTFSGEELKSSPGTLIRFVFKKLQFALAQVNYKDIATTYVILIFLAGLIMKNKSKSDLKAISLRLSQLISFLYPPTQFFLTKLYNAVHSGISQIIQVKKYIFKYHQPKLYIVSLLFIVSIGFVFGSFVGALFSVGPFLVTSRLHKFSFGGFIASVLLVISEVNILSVVLLCLLVIYFFVFFEREKGWMYKFFGIFSLFTILLLLTNKFINFLISADIFYKESFHSAVQYYLNLTELHFIQGFIISFFIVESAIVFKHILIKHVLEILVFVSVLFFLLGGGVVQVYVAGVFVLYILLGLMIDTFFIRLSLKK